MDIFSQLKDAIKEAERMAQEQAQVAQQAARAAHRGLPAPEKKRKKKKKKREGQLHREKPEAFSQGECDPTPHQGPPAEVVFKGAAGVKLGQLSPEELKRAIVLKEVLGTPPGMQDDDGW